MTVKNSSIQIPIWVFTLICGLLLSSFSVIYLFGSKVEQINDIDKRLIRIENKLDNLTPKLNGF